MQKKHNGKLLSFILCMVLIVAVALFTTGCNDGTAGGGGSSSAEAGNTDSGANAAGSEGEASEEPEQLGEGSSAFLFTVVDREGKEALFEIHTDMETVGEALLELGLIDGDESEYGLFVKTVNGITADYDRDGVYWAFYVNGEYAASGVDSTKVTEGESYAFKVE